MDGGRDCERFGKPFFRKSVSINCFFIDTWGFNEQHRKSCNSHNAMKCQHESKSAVLYSIGFT